MNRKTLVLCLALITASTGWTQRLITGQVLEEDNRAPVPYANIFIRGSMKGTVSNADGQFKIDLSGNKPTDTLTISHLSFQTTMLMLKNLPSGPRVEILLGKNGISLSEVTVATDNENKYARDLFLQVYETTKKNLALPVEVQTYCKQLVLQQGKLTRYADAQLSSIYQPKKNVLSSVEQVRILQIPVEDDNVIDISNPIAIDRIIDYGYLEPLERFIGDRTDEYRYRHYEGEGASAGDYFLIEPLLPDGGKKKNDLRYRAVVKADRQKNIQEIRISLDTANSPSRSLLGVKVSYKDIFLLLHLRTVDGLNYLYYAKSNAGVEVNYGKRHIPLNFMSELLNFSANVNNPAFDGYKKKTKVSSLFKYDNRHTHAFWERPEIPTRSKEDSRLLEELEALK
jgi:hypothetical protein